MHSLTREKMAESYQSTQILESTRMLYDLIREPEDYERWLERYSSGLIFRLGFGKVMESHNDQVSKRLFKVVHELERVASPGQYLVDTFPILMYLPDWLAPFKRELKRLHQAELDLFRGLLKDVEAQGEKAPNCWEKQYLDHKHEYGLTQDQGAYVVGTLFEAVRLPCSFSLSHVGADCVPGSRYHSSRDDELDSLHGPPPTAAGETTSRDRPSRGR